MLPEWEEFSRKVQKAAERCSEGVGGGRERRKEKTRRLAGKSGLSKGERKQGGLQEPPCQAFRLRFRKYPRQPYL